METAGAAIFTLVTALYDLEQRAIQVKRPELRADIEHAAAVLQFVCEQITVSTVAADPGRDPGNEGW